MPCGLYHARGVEADSAALAVLVECCVPLDTVNFTFVSPFAPVPLERAVRVFGEHFGHHIMEDVVFGKFCFRCRPRKAVEQPVFVWMTDHETDAQPQPGIEGNMLPVQIGEP